MDNKFDIIKSGDNDDMEEKSQVIVDESSKKDSGGNVGDDGSLPLTVESLGENLANTDGSPEISGCKKNGDEVNPHEYRYGSIQETHPGMNRSNWRRAALDEADKALKAGDMDKYNKMMYLLKNW